MTRRCSALASSLHARAVGQRSLTGRERRDKLVDVPGAAGRVVVPRVVDLQEDPLRPAVELDVGGRDAAARVVRQPQPTQLAADGHDVGLGRDPRMLPGLHGVLLGGQAERVVAQRVQDVVAGHPLEAAVDVGRDVAQRVTDVQADARRIGEHVEHVLLRARGHLLGVAQRARRVGGLEGALALPTVLPPRLDLGGQDGVIAVRRRGLGRVGLRRLRARRVCALHVGHRARALRYVVARGRRAHRGLPEVLEFRA